MYLTLHGNVCNISANLSVPKNSGDTSIADLRSWATKSAAGGEASGEDTDGLSHAVRWWPVASLIFSATGLRLRATNQPSCAEVHPWFPWRSIRISSSPVSVARREDSLQVAGDRPLQAEARGL
jgi:hypothetical protein